MVVANLECPHSLVGHVAVGADHAGAGVGALPICVDAAVRFSIPILDAGHVLNMMNGREDKSKGLRMYTLRKSRGRMSGAGPAQP